MPELPDLQVFARNLTIQLAGKKIKKVVVTQAKKLNVPVTQFEKALEGNTLKLIERKGKELHFYFKDGTELSIHLMLHGKLILFDKKNDNKHVILEFFFSNGKGLTLTDFQKQATPTLNPEANDTPDALDQKMNASYLQKQLNAHKTTIKNLVTDQSVIRGIGNAYADEILWDARISPFSRTDKIPKEKVAQLAKSIKKVLKHAEKQIDKLHPGITSGEAREFLNIHNADKLESPTGSEVRKDIVKGRKTYYTDEQELFS